MTEGHDVETPPASECGDLDDHAVPAELVELHQLLEIEAARGE